MEEIITEANKILYRRRLERKQPVDDFLRRWPRLAEEGKVKTEEPEPQPEKKEVKKIEKPKR